MPVYGQNQNLEGVQLQSMLSSASAGVGTLPKGVGHHPITCTSKLYYEEDGALACEHHEVPGDDERTQACVIHSIALMIIDQAQKL